MSTFLAALWTTLGLLRSGDSDALRHTAPSYLTEEAARTHLAAATLAGEAFSVDPALLLAVAWHESRYDAGAQSREPGRRWSCGAMTPEPHAEPCAPVELTAVGGYVAGARHLRMWLDRYEGDETKALRAYEGGGTLVQICERDGVHFVREGVDACDVKKAFQDRATWIRSVTHHYKGATT